MLKDKIFLIVILLTSSMSSISQVELGALKLNDLISQYIRSDESHGYTMNLSGNQFVRLRLDQKGVDVTITIWQPDGQPIGKFDTPNGANGAEIIALMAEDAGEYYLSVEPFSKDARGGEYSIELQIVEPIADLLVDRVDQLMSRWDSEESPGASVLIIQEDSIVLSKGYGIANLEYDISITPNTVFHIASISKQLTAFAILLLEEDGSLTLEDDIRTYVPEVPDFGKTITLKHLANHTSGLRDQWDLLTMAGWRMDDVITTDHVLKLVENQRDLNFIPGDEIMYSNTGYTLLAEVVERVSGMSFDEFTQRRIFQPLKMSNTLFYDDHEKVVKNRAYSYSVTHDGFKKNRLNYSVPGATSLFTTPEDLAKWVQNFKKPVVGTPESMNKMHIKGMLNSGDSTSYALGQVIQDYNGLYNVSHSGADAGYRTILSRFPDQNFAVIVFANDGGFPSNRIADQITNLYLSTYFKDEEKAKEPKIRRKDRVEVDTKLLESYVGDYLVEPGIVLSITLEDGRLHGEVPDQEQFDMTAESETRFKITDAKARITFHADTDGEVNALKIHQNGSIVEAPRKVEFDPMAVDLNQFTGEFYSEELSTGYDLIFHSNQLIAIHSRVADITLISSREDVFTTNSWAFDTIEFVRDKEGAITGFLASTNRVRNLWFEKK